MITVLIAQKLELLGVDPGQNSCFENKFNIYREKCRTLFSTQFTVMKKVNMIRVGTGQF